MSQGGSRRPYSRGGPRWHPRYKEYWDYDQNYSDGSSAGSPKEPRSPPPTHLGHPSHPGHHHPAHLHNKHDQRRQSVGGGSVGGSGVQRRPERRPAPADWRRHSNYGGTVTSVADRRVSPELHHYRGDFEARDMSIGGVSSGNLGEGMSSSHHQHHHPYMHHVQDTNPLAGSSASSHGMGGGSSDDSHKVGDSPSRKRRRICRHPSTGDRVETERVTATSGLPGMGSNMGVGSGSGTERRRQPFHHHHHHTRRMRYVSGVGVGGVWGEVPIVHGASPPHTPLLLDINSMSLRGTRLGGGVNVTTWPPRDHTRAQMHGVYAAPIAGYHPHHTHHPHHAGFPPPPPRATHYLGHSQRLGPDNADAMGSTGNVGGELSPLQPTQVTPPPLLLHTEARGAPLELMAPHHPHHSHHPHHPRIPHRRSMGTILQRHAARWPHHHPIHLQPQSGVPHLTTVTLNPPQTYQVFLNLLAMFPLSPFSADTGGPGEDLPNSPPGTETENYEALLTLAERLGEAKPRGLPSHQIHMLPSYKFRASRSGGGQTSCVVCMAEFEARQTLRVLPCAHEFHAKCVDKWLRSNRTCPICRGNASDYFSSSE